MKSHYIFTKENDHLKMTLSGEYDFEDFVIYLKIIYAKCENEGNYKMLLDALGVERIDIPTIERYYMGIEAAEQLNYKVKLAVVWHKEYVTYLGETVAVNRGANVGVFSSNDSAVKWLLYNIKE
jgi:hypothetical protein